MLGMRLGLEGLLVSMAAHEIHVLIESDLQPVNLGLDGVKSLGLGLFLFPLAA